jgi:hypothetical protein
MKTRTLSRQEALSLCDDSKFTDKMTLVMGEWRLNFHPKFSTCLPFYGGGFSQYFSPSTVYDLLCANLAHIEVSEPDPFDHPAFAKWRKWQHGPTDYKIEESLYIIMYPNGYVGMDLRDTDTWKIVVGVSCGQEFPEPTTVPHLGTIAAMFNSLLEANVPHPVIADTIKAFVEGLKVSA